MQKKPGNAVTRFSKALYLKLFRIHDSPQRIALGIGVGVFCGALPGAGPFAAIFLALALKVNRAAALLGSIVTNTWLSIPLFLAAARIGSAVTGVGYDGIRSEWLGLMKGFTRAGIFELSLARIVLPVVISYLAVSFCVGAAFYLVSLGLLTLFRKRPLS